MKEATLQPQDELLISVFGLCPSPCYEGGELVASQLFEL